MDLQDLLTFQTVARLGGVTRAAEALNTVQSNVTTRIKDLEYDLGAQLFLRHSRGVTLTLAGKRLMPYAARIEALVADARRAVGDEGEPAGALSIGSLETIAALRLAPHLAAYTRACPGVDLTVRTGTTASLIADVLANRLDAAFVAGPVDHPDLHAEAAFDEELVVITHPGMSDPWDPGRWRQLKILVFRAGCSYRQRFEDMLARRGISTARTLEFGTLDGIVGCVTAGVGVALLPRSVVERAAREGTVALHSLSPAEARVRTVLLRRQDSYLSSALETFFSLLRERTDGSAAA
ncbi:MAG: LysR family transcriptional regulator [Telmatospirillum sp.]|nr:LysR family transcriptional regulator [Telmatospirillum sp.]